MSLSIYPFDHPIRVVGCHPAGTKVRVARDPVHSFKSILTGSGMVLLRRSLVDPQLAFVYAASFTHRISNEGDAGPCLSAFRQRRPKGLAATGPVDYDGQMTRRLIQCAAWSALAVIVAVTISPIGMRPDEILSVDLDRALAFMVVTMLFVLGYPRQVFLCASLGICGAGVIELLQFLSPSRHPHLEDAVMKAVGVALGAVAGWLINRFRRRPKLA